MKILSFGSCMSALTATQIQDQYGCELTYVIHHNRSDNFIRYFIDKSENMIPADELAGILKTRPGDPDGANLILRNQYKRYMGLHYCKDSDLENTPDVFSYIENNDVDIILMDNFMDLAAFLMHWKTRPEFANSPIFINPSHYQNEEEILENFEYGPILATRKSACNWVKIYDWLRKLQPNAKIYFLCYHFCTSKNNRGRYNRARKFYIDLVRMTKNRDIHIIPPITVDDSLTKGENDWTHFDSKIYLAISGYIFLHASANFPKFGVPYKLPPSIWPNPEEDRPEMVSRCLRWGASIRASLRSMFS